MLALAEPEVLGEEVVREDLDLGVQLPDAAVVEPARCLDLVLGVDDRLLELEEVLAGLKLGVGLRHREDRLQRLLHVPFGDARFRRTRHVQRLRASARDVLENRLLVRGIPLHRLDQIREQVGASLQLHGDVAPRLVDANVQLHQRVVRRPQVDTGDDDDRDDDDSDDDETFCLRRQQQKQQPSKGKRNGGFAEQQQQ